MFARSFIHPLRFALVLLSLAGCNAAEAGPRGYTACGDFGGGPVECQPGQYCSDATFSECTPGCTSDVNCDDAQSCVKPAGVSVGDCQNVVARDAGGPIAMRDAGGPIAMRDAGAPIVHDSGAPVNPLIEDCQTSCQNAAFFCDDGRITPSVEAACEVWCSDSLTSDTERQTLIACVEAAFFGSGPCAEESCLP